MIKINRRALKSNGVSEVIGTILLLIISVSLFSIIYASFFSAEVQPSTPSVNLVGTVHEKELILQHLGGNDLDLETNIIIKLKDGTRISKNAESSTSIDPDKWNIGERFTHSLDGTTFRRYDPIDITVVDPVSNSVLMNGMVKEARTSDLELTMTVSDYMPFFGDTITFTIEVCNKGPSETKNVKIKDVLPKGITYKDDNSNGNYDPATHIWDVGDMSADPSQSSQHKTIEIEAEINTIDSDYQRTQIIFLLDGSDSIPNNYFDIVVKDIADAVEDGDIPHVGNKYELTIIQFATTGSGDLTTPSIVKEVGPVILTDQVGDEGYYLNIANQIKNIQQKGGYSPVAECLKQAADIVQESSFFQKDNIIIMNIMTDANPNMGYPPGIPPSNDAPHLPRFVEVIELRNYFINTLMMSVDQDQINSFIINGLYGHNKDQMKGLFVYPQPGEEWDPNIPKRGWVRLIRAEDQAEECIENQILFSISGRENIAEIIQSEYSDPDLTNNYDEVLITPQNPP